MIVVLLDKVFWLTMGTLSLGPGGLPRIYLINLVLLIAILISAITLWKWPWVSVVVAWANLLSILTRFSPWNDNSVHAFFAGFMFDHIFFIAANVGMIAVMSLKRVRRSEISARE
jgi:hypothetical protein